MVKSKGFTLIELMIVVAIIGILAAIAYPSYQESIRNTNRVNAQADMMELAQRLQRYKIANFNYLKTSGTSQIPIVLTDVSHNGLLPSSGTALYDVELEIGANNSSWQLTATPIAGSIMAGNGVLCLNSRGQKFWQKGVAVCALSETSSWDR